MADSQTKDTSTPGEKDVTPEQQALRDEAQDTFKRVQFALQMRHPDQGLRMLQPLLKKLDAQSQSAPDNDPMAFDFSNPEQAYLYFNLNPKTDPDALHPTVAPYTDAYGIHSALLYTLGDYEGAVAAINKALQFNPTDAGLYLERAMSHEAMFDFDTVQQDIEDAYPMITRAIDLARYHAFRANVLIAQGMYDLAAAHYAVYEDFDPDDVYANPHEELHELGHRTGHGHAYAHLTSADAAKRLQRARENYGPSDLAVSTLQQIMNDSINLRHPEDARAAAQSLWDITHFDGWKTLIEKFDELARMTPDERKAAASKAAADEADTAPAPDSPADTSDNKKESDSNE